MTWNINTSPATMAEGVQLNPVEVLYRYDTPFLFQTKMGIVDALCYKLEELGDTDLYLICPTDEKTVVALKSGLLSVRGALNAASYWIVEAHGFEARRSWAVRKEDLPVDFLPEPKNGLFSHFGEVPDAIESADAFLSVKFSGPELSERGLSLKIFKGLVDEVHTALNRLFTPSAIGGTRTSQLFDFEIAQPQFASLLITIKQPIVDVEGIRRRNKVENENLESEIRSELITDRDEFFNVTEGLAERASGNGAIASIIGDNYSLVSVISNLIPSQGGGYDRVEFNANTPHGRRRVVIDEVAGQRIHEAHEAASTRRVALAGVIIEINSMRRTFVLRTRADRQTTCALDYETYDRLENDGSIVIGAKVRVRGDFSRRVRRDYLSVDQEPEFEP